jgi:SagB-type dehydrogenase family enzyme
VPNQAIEICRGYMEAVFQRSTKPVESFRFTPNWADQPSLYKMYRDVERIPLPLQFPAHLASMGQILERFLHPISTSRALDYSELATLLLFTHGVLNRRLDITWNLDSRARAQYNRAQFGRGTASGGGRYPTEVFWVCGPGATLQTGIYHYDSAHHALARLFIGDVTGRIRRAVHEHPAALATDQFLLISLNFWKNSFKYGSFCYHVVTEDLGALLGSLRIAALGFGVDFPFLLWYQDEALNDLLGLETLSESVFAVIPLPPSEPLQPSAHSKTNGNEEDLRLPLVSKPVIQCSQEIIRFPWIEQVHLSALLEQEPCPLPDENNPASRDEFALDETHIKLPFPRPELLQRDVLDVFLHRQSSFGRFSSSRPLSLDAFACQLFFAAASCSYSSDVKGNERTPSFTRLMAFVNNVEGLQRGAYSYDWQQHCLEIVRLQDFSCFLQEHYMLHNYNLAESAALLVIVGNPERMLATYGNRGYRILNAEVGLVAQNIYLISTALGVNCGAALGFDNIALNQALGLDASDEQSVLFLLVGPAPEGSAGFAAPLVTKGML